MLVTIKEVAQKAGVSISTVSRALSGKVPVSEETKTKVLQAVMELKYRPNAIAQVLKLGKSKTVGLLVPNFHSLVFPAAITGITEVLSKYGYLLVLCNTEENLILEKKYVENLRLRLVDGLIFSTATDESKHILELKEEGFPVVLLLRHLAEKVDAVIADNYQGAYDGCKLLIERGFKRIAFINGSLKLDLYRKRFEGFKKAMFDGKVAPDETIIFHDVDGLEDGHRTVINMLKCKQRPDAIFATSDPKALGSIKAAREFGLRVPADISILGFDGIEITGFVDPPLSTMSQPFYELGKKSAERLVKLMNTNRKLKTVVEKVPVNLLLRGSVGYKNSFPQK